jgi:hypothetical protein
VTSTLDFEVAMRRAFVELKRTDDERELLSKKVLFADGSGWLLPVCECHANDDDLIELLGGWRTCFMDVYPTQFTVTFDGTRAWLRERVLDAVDRMMFLVVEHDGTIVGHCGLAQPSSGGVLKLDNVVRGIRTGRREIMRVALVALLGWAREHGAVRVWAPIMSTNASALSFFTRNGATVTGKRPLRRRADAGRVVFEPVAVDDTAAPDRHHVYLSFDLGG